MQHDDQHKEAIRPTVRVVNRVSASIFSDKVKDMGTVTVEKGVITIRLDFVPSMVGNDAQRDFVLDSIRLGLEACWDAKPEAFDPHAL